MKRLTANMNCVDMVKCAIIEKLKRSRTFTHNPADELIKGFTLEGERIGTFNEASRIIEYLLEDSTLIRDKKKWVWNGLNKIWNDADARRKYVRDMLLHADETRVQVIRKPGRTAIPKLVEEKIKEFEQAAIEEAPIEPVVIGLTEEAPKKDEYEEALLAEIQMHENALVELKEKLRLKEVYERITKDLPTILETINVSLDDMKSYFNDLNKVI